MMKKLSRIVLTVAILLLWAVLLPTRAQAAELADAETYIVDSGTFSSNEGKLNWGLDNHGVLSIGGTGELGGYATAPWNNYLNDITSVVISEGFSAIGEEAFKDHKKLVTVNVAYGVTSFGHRAFYSCTNLRYVEIPYSVTSLGDYLFSDCSSMTYMNIPNSVTSIGDGAFKNCSDLQTVIIPDSVTTIGDEAFAYCTSLTSVNIPNGIDSIGDLVFYYCESLPLIDIPDSVTSIGDHAFYSCTSLTTIHIPNSVTTIANGAFSRCTGLTAVEIPNSVTYIGDSAFAWCEKLVYVTLPDVVTYLGESAFSRCYKLTSITIPDGVSAIGEYTFFGCFEMVSVAIPDSVTSIGTGAFSNCEYLSNVYYEGDEQSWENITIGDSNECLLNARITYNSSGCEQVWDEGMIFKQPTCLEEGTKVYVCSVCSATKIETIAKLTTHTWNGGVVTKEATCKAEGVKTHTCTVCGTTKTESVAKLTTHTWDDGVVTKLPTTAEEGVRTFICIICDCTKTETIGKLLASGSCGEDLYYTLDAEGMLTISGTGEMREGHTWSPIGTIKNVIIQEGVTSISRCAFQGCRELLSITLPDSITSIGESAFSVCENLQSITLPSGLQELGDGAFSNCKSLTQITIPSEITRIGDGLFAHCTSLTSVTLPESVTEIGNHAFSNCDSLPGIKIPDSVTTIGEMAFFNCIGFTEFTIPEGVTSIGKAAFHQCKNLTEIVIPESVTVISSELFFNCIKLEAITIPASVTQIESSAFYECPNLSDVYIFDPNAWCKIQFGENDANPLGSGARLHILDAEGGEVASVVLDETVTEIPDYGFANCEHLVSIMLHDGVTAIGSNAFASCGNLREITVPGSVTTIGPQTFSHCENLERVVLASGVTGIGEQAFFGCKNLTGISFADSVTEIADEAFFLCENLEEVIYDGTLEQWRAVTIGENNDCLTNATLTVNCIDSAQHIWDEGEITRAPTCVQEGVKTYTCTACGFQKTEMLEDADAHHWDGGWTSKLPTCKEEGVHTYECTLCYMRKTEPIDKLTEHTYDGWQVVDENIHKQICSVCGYENTQSHRWKEIGYISLQPTCKDEGVFTYDCAACTAKKTEPIDKLTDHNYEQWVLVDENTHKQVCGICGKEETASHSWGEGWVYLQPTCKDEGIRKFLCSVCGGEKTEAIPKLTVHEWNDWSKLDDSTHQRDCRVCGQKETGEHSWNEGRQTIPPTCGEEGEMTYQCTVCYCTKTEPVEKTTDHQWDDGFMTRGATCITEGLMTYTCYVCGSTRTEVIPVLSEHYWNGWVKADEVSHKNVCLTCGKTETATHSWDAGQVSVQPTCATQGEKIYSCTVCYCTKIEVLDKLTEHTWDGGVMTQGPTCLTEGVTTYTCTVCGNTRTEAIPVLTEHYWNGWEKADDGSHKNVCMTCGKTETASHSWDSSWFERMPTCGVEGEKISQCSVCSATKFETVPKLTQHTWIGNWEYTDGNNHKQTCTVCGKEDAASHNWGNSWISVVPTCAAEGEKSYQCTVCYGTKTEVLEKLTTHSFGSWTAVDDSTHTGSCAVCQKEETFAHSWDGGWIERQPSCAEEGVKTYRCTACDRIKTEMLPKLTTHSWDGGVVTAEPTKEAEGVKTYTCAVCGETMSEAIPKIPTYTVVFKNWDGTVLSSGQYAIGEEVTAPADPTRPTDKDHSYAFAGWDQAVVSCAGNAVYTATYTQGPPVPETITSSTHTVSGNTISNIGTGTTTEKLLENLNEGAYVKVYDGNEEVSKDTLLGTGMTVKIMDGDRVVTEVTAVVTGDTNGDGKITITDMLSAKAHLLKKDTLEGAYAQGGDTNGDGNISITDFLQMKAHILGRDKVEAAPVAPAPAAAATSETDAAVTVAYYSVTEAFVPGKKSLLAI